MKWLLVGGLFGVIALLSIGLLACAVSLLNTGDCWLGLAIVAVFAVCGWDVWRSWRRGRDDRAYRKAVQRGFRAELARWPAAMRPEDIKRVAADWDDRPYRALARGSFSKRPVYIVESNPGFVDDNWVKGDWLNGSEK